MPRGVYKRSYKQIEQMRRVGRANKGGHLSLATRQKIGRAKIGKKNPMYGKPSPRKGKKMSDEFRENCRQRQLGEKRSVKTREKMSESQKNIWQGKSKEFWEARNRKISEGMRGENNPSWRGGKSFGLYGIEFNGKLKEQVRKRDNYACQECGKTQDEELKQFGCRISIHHNDYDKRNNNLDNLVSLCRGCHSRTSFNREYWTKHFNEKLLQKSILLRRTHGKSVVK